MLRLLKWMIFIFGNIAKAQPLCKTVMDDYGICVPDKCSIWFDSCNVCLYSNHTLRCSDNQCSEVKQGTCIDTNYEKNLCPLLNCGLYCPNGYETDQNGCDICHCSDVSVSHGFYKEPYQIPCSSNNVCPIITEYSVSGVRDHTTYRFYLEGKDIYNVYALFGTKGHELYLPEAYHSNKPYGSNVGGINPIIIQSNPESYFDSWLTIIVDDGDPKHLLESVGIDFSKWTSEASFSTNNGALFLMEPRQKITTSNHFLIGQMTLHNHKGHKFQINAQGRNTKEDIGDYLWHENEIQFHIKSKNSGH